jgi:hypothetical protein
MKSPFPTAAEDTARILQEAARAGLTVMIPGALESRVGRSSTRAATVTAAPMPPHVQTVVMPDWQRLEYEREGGGAPSERPSGRRQTLLARLRHWALYPADLPASWAPTTEER